MVTVNLPTAGVDYHAPFGGRKGSSYGPREQGRYAVEFYTAVKTTYQLAGLKPEHGSANAPLESPPCGRRLGIGPLSWQRLRSTRLRANRSRLDKGGWRRTLPP